MKAFIVVGPESSGTRITTKILVKSGCFGDDGLEQRLDEVVRSGVPFEQPRIVIRRSVPNGEDPEPDIDHVRHVFEENGYKTYFILTVRDWYANYKSNVSYGFTEKLSLQKLVKGWVWLVGKVKPPFFFFNTSLLFKDPEAALQSLEWFVSFPINREIVSEIFDADKKHFMRMANGI